MTKNHTRGEASRLTSEQIDALRPGIAQIKLIFVALVSGVVLFGVVAVVFGGPLELVLPPDMLSLILLGISLVTGVQGLVAPGIIRSAASRKLTPVMTVTRLAGIWNSSTLVGIALLESAAFLNLVGIFMESNVIHLVVAGLFFALMFVHYPGTNRILDWIDRTASQR